VTTHPSHLSGGPAAPIEPPPPAEQPATARRARSIVLAVALLVGLAGFFRLRFLGYSELQGDEARAMLMARQIAATGDLEVLLLHKKGPLEVLLPLMTVLAGHLGEGAARLPFALAGLLGVLAGFGLGRRLWNPRAGFLAALILAIDGYLIAFARIVQYQSVVFLLSVLAVWCAVRFHQGAGSDRRDLALAGLCLGLGSWAHYEMIFALPPVAWLVLARGWRERWPADAWLRRLALPVGLMIGVVALFYLPFIRHPHFAETSAYITERRIGGGLLYNMLGDYFSRASFYNASYYVLFMAAALVAVLSARLIQAFRRLGRGLAAAWWLALGALIVRPEDFRIGPDGPSLALLVFLPVLVALLASRRIEREWRVMLLWFAGPFLVASFLTQKPHTHFYTMVPAWALLVGWGLDRGLGRLEGRIGPRAARGGAAVVGGVLLAVFAWHQYAVFIRHSPEHKRVYPEARLQGYWTPYGDELPRGGYFGFPYRAGWNEVRRLFADGTLAGDYDSNEEPLITGWYTEGAVRCAERPRYYLVAWRPQDAVEIPEDVIEKDYHLCAVVQVGGLDKLWVYDREPVRGPVQVIDGTPGGQLGGSPAAIAVGSAPTRPVIPVSQALELPVPQVRRDVRLGEAIRFLGQDVRPPGSSSWPHEGQPDSTPTGALRPGDRLGVVLLWRVEAPVTRNFASFVHLVGEDGRTVAQSDHWPDCGRAPTSTWQPGEVHTDGHLVALPPDLAPGTYTLRAGLAEAETGARLPVHLEDGSTGDTVQLGQLTVGDT
jgi:4-amino-4-deoxy-L-arabinose transferase-like glycosyltransferase